MLTNKTKYAVAVAGAASMVGREMVELLSERNFPISELILLDTEDSAGERIEFQGRNIVVRELTKDSFTGVDVAFLFTDGERSLKFAPIAVTAGAVAIDSSGAFSTAPNAPLVVPEVNAQVLTSHRGIIANPNSLAIGMALVLKPIHDAVKIKRIVATTLQSVSGNGKKGMDELAQQTVALLNFRDVEQSAYPHQIAFNCLPQVGSFLDNGSSQEEATMVRETGKILDDASIRIAITSVCVSVFRGHSASINMETVSAIAVNELRALLAAVPGVIVFDDPGKGVYPLPIDVVGKDEVFVGRIREDGSITNGFNLWIALDNIRKGSALNAVQIAEYLIK